MVEYLTLRLENFRSSREDLAPTLTKYSLDDPENKEAVIARLLVWFDSVRDLSFAGYPWDFPVKETIDPNYYTWAIPMYTPQTKLLLFEDTEINTPIGYTKTLLSMINSVVKPVQTSVTNEEAQLRAEIREIQTEAKKVAEYVKQISAACPINPLHFEIIVKSGCLLPVFMGEPLNFGYLMAGIRANRNLLVQSAAEENTLESVSKDQLEEQKAYSEYVEEVEMND